LETSIFARVGNAFGVALAAALVAVADAVVAASLEDVVADAVVASPVEVEDDVGVESLGVDAVAVPRGRGIYPGGD